MALLLTVPSLWQTRNLLSKRYVKIRLVAADGFSSASGISARAAGNEHSSAASARQTTGDVRFSIPSPQSFHSGLASLAVPLTKRRVEYKNEISRKWNDFLGNLARVVESLEKQLAAFLRQKRGELSYAEFSRKMGLPSSTLHRLEMCEQSITLRRLQQIMKRSKCSLRDIFPSQ